MPQGGLGGTSRWRVGRAGVEPVFENIQIKGAQIL